MASASEKEMYRNLKKMEDELKKARQEAAARVRPVLQSGGKMAVFKIGYDASKRSFKKLFTKRHKHMLKLCATTVSRRPVCPPDLSFVGVTTNAPECRSTFHIVEIGHPARHGHGVQLTFRESNLYFVAFRPFAKGRKDDGWFRFFDEKIPSYLESNIIDYTPSYQNLNGVTFGKDCLRQICDTLHGFTKGNAMERNPERRQALRSIAFMFSEAQRFWLVQSELLQKLHEGATSEVKHLDSLIHSWASRSRDTFKEVKAAKETAVDEITARLRKRSADEEDAADEEYHKMSKEILVYFYDEKDTPKLIVWQQRAAAVKKKLETLRAKLKAVV